MANFLDYIDGFVDIATIFDTSYKLIVGKDVDEMDAVSTAVAAGKLIAKASRGGVTQYFMPTLTKTGRPVTALAKINLSKEAIVGTPSFLTVLTMTPEAAVATIGAGPVVAMCAAAGGAGLWGGWKIGVPLGEYLADKLNPANPEGQNWHNALVDTGEYNPDTQTVNIYVYEDGRTALSPSVVEVCTRLAGSLGAFKSELVLPSGQQNLQIEPGDTIESPALNVQESLAFFNNKFLQLKNIHSQDEVDARLWDMAMSECVNQMYNYFFDRVDDNGSPVCTIISVNTFTESNGDFTTKHLVVNIQRNNSPAYYVKRFHGYTGNDVVDIVPFAVITESGALHQSFDFDIVGLGYNIPTIGSEYHADCTIYHDWDGELVYDYHSRTYVSQYNQPSNLLGQVYFSEEVIEYSGFTGGFLLHNLVSRGGEDGSVSIVKWQNNGDYTRPSEWDEKDTDSWTINDNSVHFGDTINNITNNSIDPSIWQPIIYPSINLPDIDLPVKLPIKLPVIDPDDPLDVPSIDKPQDEVVDDDPNPTNPSDPINKLPFPNPSSPTIPGVDLPDVDLPSVAPVPIIDTGIVPVPVVPPADVDGHGKLLNVYNPNDTELGYLGDYMWSESFWDNIGKLLTDPINGIISLHRIFVTPDIASTAVEITCCGKGTGVYTAAVKHQFKRIDCGSVKVNKIYSNVLDYEPYTKVSCYLPFIGFVDLSANDVMDSTINIEYIVDLYSGDCIANIRVKRNDLDAIMYTYTGNCSVPMPITGANYASLYRNTIMGALGGAVTGGIGGAILGAAGGVATGSVNVSRSGSIGSNAYAMGVKKPYIVITRPKQYVPSKYQDLVGLPSYISTTLKQCGGYTVVESIHLVGSNATADEISEIESLLKEGVHI